MKLQQILKDSNYKLTQFSQEMIADLETRIIEKDSKGKVTYKVECLIRKKEINLTPEEIIRQLYLQILLQDYHYPAKRIEVEYVVSFGVEKKRADIAIMDKDRPETPYIIIELKKPKLKDGKDQLKGYCNATGAPIGVWTNGEQISYYHRKDPNYFEDINHIPHANEKLSDVLTERWTIADLIKNDKLLNEKKSLKDLILEMEDEVLANAGVDVFEELFKLIFTKLYDEMEGGRNPQRHLEFRNNGDTEFELKTKIQLLFEKANKRWEGVFAEKSKIELTLSHLSICVAALQNVKLFNSNLEVVDEAFEYLINKTSKGEKGQYFTPRYVIDMCIKMLNPKEKETIIDTAAGSCGFPVHTIFYVWKQILKEEGTAQSHLFTSEKKPARCEDYVKEKVFAIDFDEKAVRVGRTLNLIAGDGQTNVLHLNTLDYDRWHERTDEDKDEMWHDTYGEGWRRLKRLRTKSNDNGGFEFDILMANPPFAGDIKESRMLAKYDLGKKPDGKRQSAVGRDILFIERNLDFLKEGGRMAVVLPQGRFNNSSDKAIREFISERCRILAIVGLHGNVFKPHTGTKTSVLFVQKWTDNNGICPRQTDYPIFFATMQKPSKDNSGDKIYIKQQDGEYLLDEHGHLIVEHDLFNHEGLTQDGIAEAFIEFAKKEKLSFFDLDLLGFKNLEGLYAEPFNETKYKALLERLEISEVMLSLLNEDKRFDAEFYDKQSETIKNQLIRNDFILLGDLAKNITDMGAFSLYRSEYFVEKGIPFLRVNNVKNNFLDLSDVIFISPEYHNFLKKSQVKHKDVLLTTKAIIGMSCTVENDIKECNMSQNLVRIIINEKIINPYYLSTFLNSKYGKTQTIKSATGNVQLYLNFEKIKAIKVPKVSAELQTNIQTLLEVSENKRKGSKNNYAQAENLLLEELGMVDFSPSNKNINTKSFKDSFLATGRLDAEYYQPKYDYIENIFNKFPRITLANLVNYPISSGITPKAGGDDYTDAENGVPFIRAVDLQNGQVNIANFNYIKPEVHTKTLKRTQLKQNDFLFSIAGTVGRCAIFEHNFEANINQAVAILRFNEDRVNHYYLMVLFNSKIGKEFVEKYARQGLQTNLNLSEVGGLSIPIIDIKIQIKIAELVQQSFALKSESEKLLETAKRAVEIAIETNEQTALDYISHSYKSMTLS